MVLGEASASNASRVPISMLMKQGLKTLEFSGSRIVVTIGRECELPGRSAALRTRRATPIPSAELYPPDMNGM